MPHVSLTAVFHDLNSFPVISLLNRQSIEPYIEQQYSFVAFRISTGLAKLKQSLISTESEMNFDLFDLTSVSMVPV